MLPPPRPPVLKKGTVLKVCKVCHEKKDDECFYIKGNSFYKESSCLECSLLASEERLKLVQTKKCSMCGEEKDIGQFLHIIRKNRGRIEVGSQCEPCRAIYRKRHWESYTNKDMANQTRKNREALRWKLPTEYYLLLQAQDGKCEICGNEDPKNEKTNKFYKDLPKNEPHRLLCGDCKKKVRKERDAITDKKYRETHKEQLRKLGSNWQKNNVEKVRASALKWAREHPEQGRNAHMKREYGITWDEYCFHLEKQGHRCAICGKDNNGKRNFAVDHCHQTGSLRGLLCNPCNSALGQFGDSADTLYKAIEYLEGTGKWLRLIAVS